MSSKFQSTSIAISIVGALLLWGANATAQTVEWQVADAHANGTGCNDDNTMFMQVGGTVTVGGIVIANGQLEIMFSDMGLDVPPEGGTGLKNCLAAVPIAVDPGPLTSLAFILKQELEWGWVKAVAEGKGSVSLTPVFCDRKMPKLYVETPPVAGSAIDLFSPAPVAVSIRPVPTQCLYRANIVVSANSPGAMSIGIYGETVDLYVLFI